jgi:hypothetical protein
MGGYPCVHGPQYIPDRNANCPLPMFMRSPTQSDVSCGQILCYDMGWNAGQDAGSLRFEGYSKSCLELPQRATN